MASPGPADNTNELQITDLAEVLQLLRRHGFSGDRYHNLGLYLGLSVNTISVIEADHRGAGRCLSDCLTKWLEKADNVQKKSGPTIYSLVSALRELGEHAVAEGIDMENDTYKYRHHLLVTLEDAYR
uniref:Death domain-containing protein n=1 Tax=Amphimedon queenslandica TaxID=400682 RepID=A0A1X7TCG6_AMPQE